VILIYNALDLSLNLSSYFTSSV